MPATSVRFAAWPQQSIAPVVQREHDQFKSEAKALFLKARQHLSNGDLDNAWAALGMILNSWLRHRFVEVTGKVGTPTRDSEALLNKLRSGGVIDKWQQTALQLGVNRPPFLSRYHVAMLSGIIAGMCFCDNGTDATA
jgi:hypothetical protein